MLPWFLVAGALMLAGGLFFLAALTHRAAERRLALRRRQAPIIWSHNAFELNQLV